MTILAPTSETAFLSQILELSAMLGWEGAHFRPALTGRGWRTPVQGSLGKGWPDLILIRERDRRLIVAELKSDAGKLTPEQRHVLITFARLQEDEDTCTCSLVRGVDFAHAAGCHYANLKRGIEVYVWRPAGFDEITEILR